MSGVSLLVCRVAPSSPRSADADGNTVTGRHDVGSIGRAGDRGSQGRRSQSRRGSKSCGSCRRTQNSPPPTARNSARPAPAPPSRSARCRRHWQTWKHHITQDPPVTRVAVLGAACTEELDACQPTMPSPEKLPAAKDPLTPTPVLFQLKMAEAVSSTPSCHRRWAWPADHPGCTEELPVKLVTPRPQQARP